MSFSTNEIKEIVSAISGYNNMDYSNYELSFLKRRFSMIFDLFYIKKTEQFLELLKSEISRDKVIGEMFVDTSEMFRDPSFWRCLRDEILDRIPKNEATIWFPNETGESVYSLSIILHEKNIEDGITILCNNPSKYRCKNIIDGILDIKKFELNLSNYKRLENKDLFESYFFNGNESISYYLRTIVKCKQVSYDKTIENENVAMIISRNQTLYYNQYLSEKYFETLFKKLQPGGFLAIGIKEWLPPSIAKKLIVVNEVEKIYQKAK